MTEAKTKIFLTGPFQIIRDDGQDVTPRGTKAKALLALVLLSKNAIRSRAWLQDKLWSESSPAQGAASLRKELSVLSKHFSKHKVDFLEVTRETVSINLAAVEVDLFDEQLSSDRAELLEGLDVADPEFEAWLTVERQAYWDIDTESDGPVLAGRGLPVHWGRLRPAVVVEPFEVVGETPDISIAASSIRDELMFLLGTMSDVIELRDARRQEGPVEGYVLSGSVVGAEGLRVAAQLTSTADQICLWTQRFRFRAKESFDAVEEIAMKVVEALQLRLRDGYWSEIWSGRATSTEAWSAFQKARILESQATEDGLQDAIRQYRACLEFDPGYLPARVAIGFCHLDMIRLGMDANPAETLAMVEVECKILRNLNPTDPYCSALHAFTHSVAGNTSEACSLMLAVVERFSGSPELLGYYGILLVYDDRAEEGVSVCKKALALTPHPPIWIEANLAIAMMMTGDKAAWQHAHNVLRVDPGRVRPRVVLCMLSAAAGNHSLARRHARQILELQPGFAAERWAWPGCFKNRRHYEEGVRLLSAAGL